jgi:hypothetical protein
MNALVGYRSSDEEDEVQPEKPTKVRGRSTIDVLDKIMDHYL